mgnify:CR=1 FL=1
MIRSLKLNISYANQGKLNSLDTLFIESKIVINKFIDILWEKQDFKSKFIDFKIENTWLSSALQQSLSKQALETVKSQRKKLKKTKPIFKQNSIVLDQRFIKDIQFDNNSFDIWIRLWNLGNHIILNIPSKRYNYFNKFVNNDWKLKKSIRLRKVNNQYFIDVFLKKEQPILKLEGKKIGLDCGYKKLLISSENKVYDNNLEQIYNKISRKKQGSKAFKRSLKERNDKISESINKIEFNEIKTIIVEDLKDVKKNSKNKINKNFNNKLQRWLYSKVLDKLSRSCEEKGIEFIKVNPAYTSQECSQCGFKHKDNRSKEQFLCLNCGYKTDADYNASVNILKRGVYGSSFKKANL